MEHKSNQRKFRLDDMKEEIIAKPRIVRGYFAKQIKGEHSDRTFCISELFCNCNKHCSCNSEGCDCYGHYGSRGCSTHCRCQNEGGGYGASGVGV